MTDISDRVAVLEEQRKTDRELLEEIHTTVKELHGDIQKYKGAIGAIFLLFSGVAAFIGLIKGWFIIKWTGGA